MIKNKKQSIYILILVGMSLVLVLLILLTRFNLLIKAEGDTVLLVDFTTNRMNHFRLATTSGYLQKIDDWQTGKVIFKSPAADAPVTNPHKGVIKYTIDSYQKTTEWFSFTQEFPFSQDYLNQGIAATIRVKTGNSLVNSEADGTFSSSIPISTYTAYIPKKGKTPLTGRYLTVEMTVAVRPGGKTIEFNHFLVNAKSYRIACPVDLEKGVKTPRPIPVSYNGTGSNKVVSSCFGDPNSALVKKYLIDMTFKGRNIESKIHQAMIPNVLQAENSIWSYEEAVGNGTNYEVKTLSGFVNKTIDNGAVASTHSWGLAFDINAANNGAKFRSEMCNCPYPETECCPHDLPDYVVSFLESTGLGWGARFTKKCDAMHFQYGGKAWPI